MFRGRLNWPEDAENKRSIKAVNAMRPLEKMFKDLGDASIQPHLSTLVALIMVCTGVHAWSFVSQAWKVWA